MSGRARAWLCLLVVVALGSAACSGPDDESRARLAAARAHRMAASTTTSSTTTTTTTTTTTPPAAPAAAAAPEGLGPGARGAAVLALEQKLDALRFDPGTIDEAFDANTAHAVMAFQKVHGMERTGRATHEVAAAIDAAQGVPGAFVPGGGPLRVEIDLARQVLFLFEGDTLTRILPVSSGNKKRYCAEGSCGVAITPTGAFKVYRKARGWEKSPLGRLYNSQYFTGGYAIHGSTSVPGYPASHGCVRIPMNAAEWFPDKVPMGTPVYVISEDGEVPTPLPPDDPTTTSTTMPPETTTSAPPPTVAPPVPTTAPPLLPPLFGSPTQPPPEQTTTAPAPPA